LVDIPPRSTADTDVNGDEGGTNEPHKATAIDRCSTLDGAKYLPTSSSHVVGFQVDRAAKGVDATRDKKTTEESSNDAQ